MEADSYLLFLVLGVLLLLALFFAGTETAILTISHSEQKELKKKSTKRSARLLKLLSHPKSLLVSIKFAVHIINTAIIVVSFLLSDILSKSLDVPYGYTLLVVLGLTTTILFIIHALWSNVIVIRYGQRFAEMSSLPLLLYFKIVQPIAALVTKFQNYLVNKFGISKRSSLLDHHKLIAMVENGKEMSELEASEREMIHSIFEFGETEVHEIMVPRIDMVCVEQDTSLEDLTRLIKDKGHSRIPLYKDGVDNITGILYAKDLLPYLINQKGKEIDLEKLARPVSFVPESKKLHHLLREFQQEKYHMAIVVDEYGGTAGLVTFEDVIEEIVGDIQDEYDQEPPLYRKLDEATFMVDAKIDLHDLNEKLDLDLPTEGEYESLGGFIFSLTGYVPEENEVVKYENYTFIVENIERNRIVRVKLVHQKELVNEETKLD